MRFKFKAEKCTITEGLEKTLSSGDSYCITLNTENAGNGAVTCRIKSVNGRYVILLVSWNIVAITSCILLSAIWILT